MSSDKHGMLGTNGTFGSKWDAMDAMELFLHPPGPPQPKSESGVPSSDFGFAAKAAQPAGLRETNFRGSEFSGHSLIRFRLKHQLERVGSTDSKTQTEANAKAKALRLKLQDEMFLMRNF